MSDTSQTSAPRPWYKTWWKLILALIFWPFVLTWKVAKSNWKFLPKLGGITGIWIGWFILTSIWSTQETKNYSVNPEPEVESETFGFIGEDNADINIPEVNSSPAPTATSIPPTNTPRPTATPTAFPTIRPTTRPTSYPTSVPFVFPIAPPASQGSYVCNCSKTCPNMSSCAEAQYQLNVCGCSTRDADKDGVACDADCQ